MNINDWLQSLFAKGKKSSQPLVTEPIYRSQRFLSKKDKLVETEIWKGFLRNLYDMVSKQKPSQREVGMSVGFYESDYSNGFYLTQIDHMEADWFRMLCDEIKSAILQHKYTVELAEATFSEVNEDQINWEKYLLKPKLVYREGKKIQQFGNIQIEVKIKNNAPALFKFQASFFGGYNFSEPLPYAQLLAALFKRS